MLIVIEGADACGKDTVAKSLAERIGAEIVNFPHDDSVTGPLIRSYLRKEWRVEDVVGGPIILQENKKLMDALVFQALQVTNRIEVLPWVVDHLRKGTPVILVRYWQSGWVYGQLDGLSDEFLTVTHKLMPQAQLNILLDSSVETTAYRLRLRGDPPERYEYPEFHDKVLSMYRTLWGSYKYDPRWVTVDATKAVSDVIAAVTRHVTKSVCE